MKLNKLKPEELQDLYKTVVNLRKYVLNLVQTYEQTTNSLITKEFQHDIETELGKKILEKWYNENLQDLESIIQTVMSNELDIVRKYKEDPNHINYLIGKVMQKTRGRADPMKTFEIINKFIKEKYDKK